MSFCHLLKVDKGLQKGEGSRTLQYPPSYTPSACMIGKVDSLSKYKVYCTYRIVANQSKHTCFPQPSLHICMLNLANTSPSYPSRY